MSSRKGKMYRQFYILTEAFSQKASNDLIEANSSSDHEWLKEGLGEEQFEGLNQKLLKKAHEGLSGSEPDRQCQLPARTIYAYTSHFIVLNLAI